MKGHCYYCERKLNPPIGPSNKSNLDPHLARTMDHVIPRCKGGSNKRQNLKVSCSQCNTMKDDMLPEEFSAFIDLKLKEGNYSPYNKETMEIMSKNIKALISKIMPYRTSLVNTIKSRLKHPTSSMRQKRSQEEYWKSVYKDHPHVCRLLLRTKDKDLPEWVYDVPVKRK